MKKKQTVVKKKKVEYLTKDNMRRIARALDSNFKRIDADLTELEEDSDSTVDILELMTEGRAIDVGRVKKVWGKAKTAEIWGIVGTTLGVVAIVLAIML